MQKFITWISEAWSFYVTLESTALWEDFKHYYTCFIQMSQSAHLYVATMELINKLGNTLQVECMTQPDQGYYWVAIYKIHRSARLACLLMMISILLTAFYCKLLRILL